MILSCCRLISLLVAFNLIGTEHAETNLDSLCLREELKSSTLRAATLSTDTVCCRRCRSIIQDQENRGNIAFKKCIQHCKQQRDVKDNEVLARSKGRERRSSLQYETCRGLKDPTAPSPCLPEKMKVEFRTISSDTYGYNIIWEPISEFLFEVHNRTWTHYSLMYEFENDPSPDKKVNCLLVPKNNTNYTLIYHSANFKPDALRYAVVSYPFRSTFSGESAINLSEFDPLRPTFIPTFDPIFPTEGTEKSSALAWPIIGGAFAGLVLIFAMMWAFMWRKKTLRPFYRRDSQLQEINPKTDISGDLHLPEVYTRENISRDPQLQEVITKANIARDPQLSEVITKTNNIGELYYSCYYPENESFRTQVASIVNSFRKQGYNVIMDAMVTNEISSQGPPRWAENQIKRAKKVLVFLSPGLLELASSDGREIENSQDINRVWIELEVLRDIYSQNRSASKMVCIALPDMPVSSKDSPVWLKVSYRWPVEFTEILKRLNDRPSIKPA
ncbi:uncharacterized protein [Pocillopora verrucosa]|uniref:uncharacterized protein n=1 Tax=Pocillopora verrucosa TaxID=203993 RepID=UPI002797140B|nr:uncharacterized protein LOC131778986 [Pocillopora verrucosa]